MQHNTTYIFAFATVVCAVCATMISVSAVGLRAKQDYNREIDRKKSVLMAARLVGDNDALTAEQVEEKFGSIRQVVVDLETGERSDMDPAQYDPATAGVIHPAANPAQIMEMPAKVMIYEVMDGDKVSMLVLPIFGKGLWGTLYGYLALDRDLQTIRGITYYKHKETPGLGGEVENPRWKSLWPGRKAYNENGDVAITVVKGQAGTVEEDPHHVDGLSGATITSRGVTNMLHFWLGEPGFKSFLHNYEPNRSA
ncbi:MAG: Na(+)-translocating NADH-quinone reductase subunit C [Candidatus Hydrogenedens sp.]|nr:Na(+)-translocating NADH-quinone reductase subunit C [Candidatus Hydrogenedens sp.]